MSDNEAPAKEAPANSPTIIPENERLKLSNLELVCMSFMDKKNTLQAQAQALQAQEQMALKERGEYLASLALKYKFDPMEMEMDPQTGIVRPRQMQGMPPGFGQQ